MLRFGSIVVERRHATMMNLHLRTLARCVAFLSGVATIWAGETGWPVAQQLEPKEVLEKAPLLRTQLMRLTVDTATSKRPGNEKARLQ
jgi:hypothetical protein